MEIGLDNKSNAVCMTRAASLLSTFSVLERKVEQPQQHLAQVGSMSHQRHPPPLTYPYLILKNEHFLFFSL